MSNYCCPDHESAEFRSLIFNGGSINDGTESIPDTIPLGSTNSSIMLLGWLLPQGDTDEYSLTFSVPADARNKWQRTKVFVHLLTDNSNTPNGNMFAIRLSSLFARANGVVNAANIKVNNSGNIPIQNSPGNFQYNHYILEFDLDDIIKAEDFALLSVARIAATNNDYAGALFLSSIEFRYLSDEV